LTTGHGKVVQARASSASAAKTYCEQQLGHIPGGLVAWSPSHAIAHDLAGSIEAVETDYRRPWGASASCPHCTPSRTALLGSPRPEPKSAAEWSAVRDEVDRLFKTCSELDNHKQWSTNPEVAPIEDGLLFLKNHLAIHEPETLAARPPVTQWLRAARRRLVLLLWQAQYPQASGIWPIPCDLPSPQSAPLKH
jgi:hypothetical protein